MISKFQRKCFLASAGMHGLLFLVLLVGPAFFISKQQPNDLPTLEFIPSKLIDEQFYRPPAPTPQPEKTPQPQPKPAPPKETKPPDPKPVIKQPPPKPEPRYTKPEDIRVNLRPQRPTPTTQPKPTPTRDYASAAERIRQNTSPPVHVPSAPSAGGPSYANYKQYLKSVYERNWYPPDDTARDDARVNVRIEIARDGSVLSSRIIGRSGDASVDASVEATLRRVSKVRPFPEGAKELKRTFTIEFNLKTKRAMN